MTRALDIVIVGSGNRVQKFYAPILLHLKSKGSVDIKGIYNRTKNKAEDLSNTFNCLNCSSLNDLFDLNPEAIIIAIPSPMKELILENAMERGVHCFIETPLSYNPHEADRLYKKSVKMNVAVELAEDLGFTPEALFQDMILESGLIGKLKCVVNDGRGFQYHAFSRLQKYTQSLNPSHAQAINTKVPNGKLQDRYLMFGDDLTYIHRYTTPKKHMLRKNNNWSLVGEKGIVSDHDIIIKGDQEQEAICLKKSSGYGNRPSDPLNWLKLTHDGGELVWKSPYPDHWPRQQIGLAYLIERFTDHICDRSKPLAYGIERAAEGVAMWCTVETAQKLPFKKLKYRWLKIMSYMLYYFKLLKRK